MQRSIQTYPQPFQEKSLVKLIKTILSAREAIGLFHSLSRDQQSKALQVMRSMVGGV